MMLCGRSVMDMIVVRPAGEASNGSRAANHGRMPGYVLFGGHHGDRWCRRMRFTGPIHCRTNLKPLQLPSIT